MTSSIRRKKSNKNILGKPKTVIISIVTSLSIILLLIYACIHGWIGAPANNDSYYAENRTPEQVCNDPTMAFAAASAVMESQLKYPSRYIFPKYSPYDTDISITSHGDCTHSVASYLNTTGPYGTMIRKNYFMVIENILGTDKWKVQGAIIFPLDEME